jgi:hypothetical protein
MISFNNGQIDKIKKLQPLIDSKFKYNVARWTNLNADFKNEIQDFADKEIIRKDVIDAYKNYFEDNNIGFMKAFLLTMVWGFADTGYGTHRTNNYITIPENIGKIKKALEHVSSEQDGLEKAFKELNRKKGLGVSYLTKILYFATRGKGQSNYALIFDIRVASSLVKLTTPNEIFQLVTVGPSSKFNDYENYNKLIHKLAKDNNVEADQIEMYLFNQDFI